MRRLLLTAVLLGALVLCYARPEEKAAADTEYAEGDDYYDDAAEVAATAEEELAIPTIDPEVVRNILKSKEQTRKMVNCVIQFEEGCPAELERVNKMAPEIFRRGGRCFKCSTDDQKKLRDFLVELQRHQPSEYRRMIRELNKL